MRAPTVRPRDWLLPEAEAAVVVVAAGAQAAEAAAGAAGASAGRAEAIPWGTVYQLPTEMPGRCSTAMGMVAQDRSMTLAQDGPLVAHATSLATPLIGNRHPVNRGQPISLLLFRLKPLGG